MNLDKLWIIIIIFYHQRTEYMLECDVYVCNYIGNVLYTIAAAATSEAIPAIFDVIHH